MIANFNIFQSTSFWIIARAVRDFLENEGDGLLPLRGSLPDMIADTEKFVTLQQMYVGICLCKYFVSMTYLSDFFFFSYHKQAVADAEAVYRRTLQILKQLGRSSDSISEKEVKLFCRHCSELIIQRGTCVADEYDSKLTNVNTIGTGGYQYNIINSGH